MKYMLSLGLTAMMSFVFAVCCHAQAPNAVPKDSLDGSTKITLTIGNNIIPAVLYNTPPAKDLTARLPVTVSLNRGPVDYCGGIAPIAHSEDDLQAGYRSGDLAYWIHGKDFVIFTENKENASAAPDLAVLGQIKADIKEVRDLGSTIKVTIALDK